MVSLCNIWICFVVLLYKIQKASKDKIMLVRKPQVLCFWCHFMHLPQIGSPCTTRHIRTRQMNQTFPSIGNLVQMCALMPLCTRFMCAVRGTNAELCVCTHDEEHHCVPTQTQDCWSVWQTSPPPESFGHPNTRKLIHRVCLDNTTW